MVCTTSRAFWGESPECPASSPPGYSPSKKSQLPASQRPAPGSRPLATLDRSGTRGSRPPRPFVLFPLPRKRQRPRAAEERATPLELTAAAAVVLLHRQAFGLCFTLSFMLWERLVLL